MHNIICCPVPTPHVDHKEGNEKISKQKKERKEIYFQYNKINDLLLYHHNVLRVKEMCEVQQVGDSLLCVHFFCILLNGWAMLSLCSPIRVNDSSTTTRAFLPNDTESAEIYC